MGKIQAKSIFRLVPLVGDLGRFLWAFTLNSAKVILDKFLYLEKGTDDLIMVKNDSFLHLRGLIDSTVFFLLLQKLFSISFLSFYYF